MPPKPAAAGAAGAAGAAAAADGCVSKFIRYLPVFDDAGDISGERLRARHADLSEADAEYLAWMYKLYRGMDLAGKKVYAIFEMTEMAVREDRMQHAIEKWMKLEVSINGAILVVTGMHFSATVGRPWSTEGVSLKGTGAMYPTSETVESFERYIEGFQRRFGKDCEHEVKIFESLKTAFCASVNFVMTMKDQCAVFPSKIESMKIQLKQALALVEEMISSHNMVEAGTGRRVMLGRPILEHGVEWKEDVTCKGCVFCKKFVRVAAGAAAAGGGGGGGGGDEGAGLVEVEWEDVRPPSPKRSRLDMLIAVMAAGSNPPRDVLANLVARQATYAASAAAAAAKAPAAMNAD